MIGRVERVVAVLAASVFVVAIVAAGSMQSAGTTTAAARTTLLIDDVGKTTSKHSARFTITVTIVGLARQSRIVVSGVDDFRHHAVDVHLGTAEERIVAGVLYIHAPTARLPAGKSWVSVVPKGLARANYDPSATLSGLKSIRTAKVAGHPKLDGVRTTEYDITLDLASQVSGGKAGTLPPAARALIGGLSAVPGHVWVDDSDRIRGLELSLTTGPLHETIHLGFSDFGVKTSIVAPPPDQVVASTQVPDALRGVRDFAPSAGS
ncbi:MAG: LolA-like protein [Acidimicrobiales bacterium]